MTDAAKVAAGLTGETVWTTDCPPCPFCGDTGFDLPGLVYHIRGSCDAADLAYDAQIVSLRKFHENMVAAHDHRTAELERTKQHDEG